MGPRTLREHHIEALARRAAQHQGAVRQLLDARLQALRAAGTGAAPSSEPHTARALAPTPSPLAALLSHIARQHSEPGTPEARPPVAGTPAPLRELKAVRDYRSTWSRLSVGQRVNQALARVPSNAGPLNTQRLVHQALVLLRDASPAYMHRLVTQVEALLWLEGVAQAAEPAGAARKKPGAAARAAAGATGSGRS